MPEEGQWHVYHQTYVRICGITSRKTGEKEHILWRTGCKYSSHKF